MSAVSLSQDDVETLRRIINRLRPTDLDALGITILPPLPDDWQWLRDIMVIALINLDRAKSAKMLVEHDRTGKTSQYSVGVNPALFAEMSRLIRQQFDIAPGEAN